MAGHNLDVGLKSTSVFRPVRKGFWAQSDRTPYDNLSPDVIETGLVILSAEHGMSKW